MAAPRLPRSRALAMLRSPVPFAHSLAWLGVAAAFAASLARVPAFVDRAYLAEAFVYASVLRVDPAVDRALTGRWPTGLETLGIDRSNPANRTRIESREVTAHGVAVTFARRSDSARLELTYDETPGGALRWRCRVAPATPGAGVDPFSVPEVCRP
ncbi:MAG TPA: hypothetical protein VFL14_15940 [Xanthomonadales bacterium]|nr:hypothetical protein [Xanthomonadales bacterium]